MVRTSLAASLLLIVVALLVAPVGAQERESKNPFGSPPAISIAFKGGSVAQYIELINKSLAEQHEASNVIVQPGVRNIELPPIELRDVTTEAALHLLHDHVDREQDLRINVDAIHSGGGKPIFILKAEPAHMAPPNEELVHVWNVRQLLSNDVKAEDMLTAIETALTLLRSKSEPPEVRFHQATGLVMARGTKDQVRTIELVIQQLRETAVHQEMEAMRRAEIERAEAMRADSAARLQMEVETAQAEMSRFKQERDAMFLELEAARRAHEIHEREQVELRDQMKAREQELMELERRLRGKE